MKSLSRTALILIILLFFLVNVSAQDTMRLRTVSEDLSRFQEQIKDGLFRASELDDLYSAVSDLRYDNGITDWEDNRLLDEILVKYENTEILFDLYSNQRGSELVDEWYDRLLAIANEVASGGSLDFAALTRLYFEMDQFDSSEREASLGEADWQLADHILETVERAIESETVPSVLENNAIESLILDISQLAVTIDQYSSGDPLTVSETEVDNFWDELETIEDRYYAINRLYEIDLGNDLHFMSQYTQAYGNLEIIEEVLGMEDALRYRRAYIEPDLPYEASAEQIAQYYGQNLTSFNLTDGTGAVGFENLRWSGVGIVTALAFFFEDSEVDRVVLGFADLSGLERYQFIESVFTQYENYPRISQNDLPSRFHAGWDLPDKSIFLGNPLDGEPRTLVVQFVPK